MNFDYEKIKQRQSDGGTHWTSYSDLFMALSFLFLLLYVVASFRTGTVTHSAKMQLVSMEAEQKNLRQQIQIYERVSNNYLSTDASEEEKKLYQQVVDHLELLEGDSQREQKRLETALDNQRQREEQLNQYQQTIKNLIFANLNATRDIKAREQQMALRAKELKQAESALTSKVKELSQKDEALSDTTTKLLSAREEVEKTQQQVVETEQKYQVKIAEITEESRQKLAELQRETQEKRQALQEQAVELKQAQQRIAQQEQENQQLIATINRSQQESQQKIEQLRSQHEETLKQAKESFDAKLDRERMTAQEKLKAEREYRDQIESQNKKFDQTLQQLESELANKKGRLEELQGKQSELSAQNQQLSSQLSNADRQAQELAQQLAEGRAKQKEMEAALAKAKEKANRRRNISNRIADSFRNSGLDVDVNPGTGDLVMNFGDEYFDTGKFFLKSGMVDVLNQAVPIYAQSLFEDESIAKHISAVEIVGFASPTYRDRVVDPRSLAPNDRQAINYNLDLSYKRARSIFKYIFNTSKIKYQYQDRLLPMVKVTGRSFFTEEIEGQNTDGLNMKQFCEQYDCNRSQKVIIRFNLKD